MKGAEPPAHERPPGSTAEMVWSYTPHACLALEVTWLPDHHTPGPRKVFIVEEWIENEPPEDLETRVLGRRL
ncbi:unnamed protein product [Discula destructiva]